LTCAAVVARITISRSPKCSFIVAINAAENESGAREISRAYSIASFSRVEKVAIVSSVS
jgi:hypothetical protein